MIVRKFLAAIAICVSVGFLAAPLQGVGADESRDELVERLMEIAEDREHAGKCVELFELALQTLASADDSEIVNGLIETLVKGQEALYALCFTASIWGSTLTFTLSGAQRRGS